MIYITYSLDSSQKSWNVSLKSNVALKKYFNKLTKTFQY